MRFCPSILYLHFEGIRNSSLALKIANGAFWSIVGAVISRGMALLASIIMARLLGAAVFGELGIIQSTIGMFGMFAGVGLGMTATKYIAQYREKNNPKAEKIIALTTVVSIISSAIMSTFLYLGSDWLATNSLSAPHLGHILQIASLYLFLLSIVGLQNGILAGFEAFKTIAIQSAITGLSTLPLLIGGAYFFGLQGAIFGLVISSALNVLLNYLAIRTICKKNNLTIVFKSCFTEKAVLTTFALPAFLAGIMVAPINWICNMMLVNQVNGYSEMGLFNAANQWLMIILFIPGSLGTILLPMLTNLNEKGNSRSYLRTLKYNVFLNVLIAFVLCLGIIILSKTIMSSYGSGFSSGVPVLVLLSLTGILIAYTQVIGQAIASKGKMWRGFLLNFIWAFTLLGLSFFFANKGEGAVGLAKSYLIAYSLHSITSSLLLYRINEFENNET